MLRTMLVGLDGSAYSAAAVELGIEWARRFEALLVGMAVCDEPAIRQPEPIPMGAAEFKHWRDEALLLEAQKHIAEFLAHFSERCAAAGVEFKQLETVGVPHEQIENEAQRCDLVLLGQQTHFHFEVQDAPCDTLETLLRHSPRPVVAVPKELPSGSRVMVAYDGSSHAARALQAMAELGLSDTDEVAIVSVAKELATAQQHCQRAMEFLIPHGIAARGVPLASSAGVGGVLLEQARKLDVRLLVMGAFGHSTLREFFLGSVTRTVLQSSPAPVMLYH